MQPFLMFFILIKNKMPYLKNNKLFFSFMIYNTAGMIISIMKYLTV